MQALPPIRRTRAQLRALAHSAAQERDAELIAADYCPVCEVPNGLCLCAESLPTLAEGQSCACGNYAERSGFDTVDVTGKEMEPTPDWPGLYRCNECGAMYRNAA